PRWARCHSSGGPPDRRPPTLAPRGPRLLGLQAGEDDRAQGVRAGRLSPGDRVERAEGLQPREGARLEAHSGARASTPHGSSTFAARTRTALAILIVSPSPTIWTAALSSRITSDFPTRRAILRPAHSSISSASTRTFSRGSLAVTWSAPTMSAPLGCAVRS